MDLYKKITELTQRQVAVALVTVIQAKGSVPREVGAKMLVEASGKIHGTIGGGAVEKIVIDEALQVIKSGKAKISEHNLDDKQAADTGMVCGGHMQFFIEPLHQGERLYIFGGGHIAYYLSRMAELQEWPYIIIDDREEFCNSNRFPSALELAQQHPAEFAEKLNSTENDFMVVITRGHQHDYEVVRQLLKKTNGYLGMIGSKVKRKEIYTKLLNEDKFSQDEIDMIHSPIGLDIAAQTPQEIAVSIMAELIQIKNRKQK